MVSSFSPDQRRGALSCYKKSNSISSMSTQAAWHKAGSSWHWNTAQAEVPWSPYEWWSQREICHPVSYIHKFWAGDICTTWVVNVTLQVPEIVYTKSHYCWTHYKKHLQMYIHVGQVGIKIQIWEANIYLYAKRHACDMHYFIGVMSGYTGNNSW